MHVERSLQPGENPGIDMARKRIRIECRMSREMGRDCEVTRVDIGGTKEVWCAVSTGKP